MRRNMDLIKLLLEAVERTPAGSYYHPDPSDFPDGARPSVEELHEHCRLVVERGLVYGSDTRAGWSLGRLTWDGHDFIDNSRNSEVWQATKRVAGNLSFDVFVKVMVEVASRWAMSHLTGF